MLGLDLCFSRLTSPSKVETYLVVLQNTVLWMSPESGHIQTSCTMNITQWNRNNDIYLAQFGQSVRLLPAGEYRIIKLSLGLDTTPSCSPAHFILTIYYLLLKKTNNLK